MENKLLGALPFHFIDTYTSHSALDSNYSVWALKMTQDNIIKLPRKFSTPESQREMEHIPRGGPQTGSSCLDVTASVQTQGTPNFTAFVKQPTKEAEAGHP